MTAPALPAPGFTDPTRDAQRAFRAVLDALAHPTCPYPVAGPAEPPAALGRGLAAVALTLLDEDCAVWLGGALDRDTEVAVLITNGPSDGSPQTPLPSGGHGLIGMRERVTTHGGGFAAGPTPDGGFRVSAMLPTP